MQKLIIRNFILHFIFEQVKYLLQPDDRIHIIILVNKIGIAKFINDLCHDAFPKLNPPLLL